MRQLLVMSPRAFLGYEFSPAVAGNVLAPLLPLCTLKILESTFAAVLLPHWNSITVPPAALACKELRFAGFSWSFAALADDTL